MTKWEACTDIHSGTNRDERCPPLLCPDVSATRLDGGLDTSLQVTSKLGLALMFKKKYYHRSNDLNRSLFRLKNIPLDITVPLRDFLAV
jgi:hypothetical protein